MGSVVLRRSSVRGSRATYYTSGNACANGNPSADANLRSVRLPDANADVTTTHLPNLPRLRPCPGAAGARRDDAVGANLEQPNAGTAATVEGARGMGAGGGSRVVRDRAAQHGKQRATGNVYAMSAHALAAIADAGRALSRRQLEALRLMVHAEQRDFEDSEMVYECGECWVGLEKFSPRTFFALVRACAISRVDGEPGGYELWKINETGRRLAAASEP